MNDMNKAPQTLKGFRDFLPEEKRKRDWVQSKIVEVFKSFGFEPLETPTLEYAELLLGKYGDEADQLVYTFQDKGDRSVGLRYDQTVPTARVLGQYQNDLPRYFRRYQIQNVFRADKPQKGRYREFTQCDIDIFGSTSPLSDAEILACTYQAYKNIGFDQVTIKVNTRPNLISIVQEFSDEKVSVNSIINSIDKLDKVKKEGVIKELVKKGLNRLLAQSLIDGILVGKKAPEDLQSIIDQAKQIGVDTNSLIFDPTLARGLDYYTGLIFEVIIPEFTVGSVGGGGRYDKLINDLMGQDIPAVGMAFGFDRTVEAADQLGLIPSQTSTSQVLVTVFDESTLENSLKTAAALRQAGIKTELYPALDKLGKQFKLADQKAIPYVVIIGEAEAAQNKLSLKNLKTGEQKVLTIETTIEQLNS